MSGLFPFTSRRVRWIAPIFLVSCEQSTGGDRWTDQLQADGPCWQVDLSNGLDEETALELHALYDCLNQRGELDDLGPVDQALDSSSRQERALGGELGRGINQAASQDVDLLGLAGTLLDLLEEDLAPQWLHLAAEVIHGQSWSVLQGTEDINSPDAGPIFPAIPVIQEVAEADLDASAGTLDMMGQLLQAQITGDAMCSVIALEESQDSTLQSLRERLVLDLGDGLAQSLDPTNDHWAEASGSSIEDLVQVMAVRQGGQSQSMLQEMSPGLLVLLSSTALRYQMQDVLEEIHEDGNLEALPDQLRDLAIEDADGGSLSPSEDSAWVSLLRLLARGNTEVSCSVDLWLIEIEIDLGNMSVAILRELAQRVPEDMEPGVTLLGNILGATLSQATLEAIAASGVCPALDSQMVSDLAAIDRLSDDDAGDLLVVMLKALSAFHDAGNDDDLIEELVDLVTIVYEGGGADPSQEVLRDLGYTDLAVDGAILLGLLVDHDSLDASSCPSGTTLLSLDTAWASLESLLSQTEQGQGVAGAQPVLEAALGHDGTWTAIEQSVPWLQDPDAEVANLPSLAAQTLSLDPDRQTLSAVADLLRSSPADSPLLRVLEHPDWTQAIQSEDGPTGGPMLYLSSLIRSGTLDALLTRANHLIQMTRELAEEVAEE